MFNLDDITKANNEDHDLTWPYIPDHPYRLGKANVLLNLMKELEDIDKIYLYAKDLHELKYQFLIKKS